MAYTDVWNWSFRLGRANALLKITKRTKTLLCRLVDLPAFRNPGESLSLFLIFLEPVHKPRQLGRRRISGSEKVFRL